MQAYTKTSLSELCISHSPELCLLRETVVYTCYCICLKQSEQTLTVRVLFIENIKSECQREEARGC